MSHHLVIGVKLGAGDISKLPQVRHKRLHAAQLLAADRTHLLDQFDLLRCDVNLLCYHSNYTREIACMYTKSVTYKLCLRAGG